MTQLNRSLNNARKLLQTGCSRNLREMRAGIGACGARKLGRKWLTESEQRLAKNAVAVRCVANLCFLMRLDALWRWMREEVSQHHGCDALRTRFNACRIFIATIGKDLLAIVDRQWPRRELDPEMERLRFSF